MKCIICNKREANVIFVKSYLDYSHGFKKDICRQCYIKIIEDEIKRIKRNLIKQKKLLKEEKKNDNL